MTYYHICTPDRHKTDCTDSLTLTTTRPKKDSGVLVIEFHPPRGEEENVGSQVETEEALRWPHVISYG